MEKLNAHERLAKMPTKTQETVQLLLGAMRSDWINQFAHIPATKVQCERIYADFPEAKRWELSAMGDIARTIEKGTR